MLGGGGAMSCGKAAWMNFCGRFLLSSGASLTVRDPQFKSFASLLALIQSMTTQNGEARMTLVTYGRSDPSRGHFFTCNMIFFIYIFDATKKVKYLLVQ